MQILFFFFHIVPSYSTIAHINFSKLHFQTKCYFTINAANALQGLLYKTTFHKQVSGTPPQKKKEYKTSLKICNSSLGTTCGVEGKASTDFSGPPLGWVTQNYTQGFTSNLVPVFKVLARDIDELPNWCSLYHQSEVKKSLHICLPIKCYSHS